MKNLFLVLFIVFFTPCVWAAGSATDGIVVDLTQYTAMGETTRDKLLRRASDLYLRGDLAAAADAFQGILAIDCRDEQAISYLKKIAAAGPDYQDVADYLEDFSCQGSRQAAMVPVRAASPVVATAPVVVSRPATVSTSEMYFPSGRRDSSVIHMRKEGPSVVRIGQSFSYTINVENISNIELQNVNISEVIPEGFVIGEMSPVQTRRDANTSVWVLSSLKPFETKTVRISGRSDSKQNLPCCTNVTYQMPALCIEPVVIQPELSVALSAPATQLVCDRIPLTYKVSNTGDGDITGVKVTTVLPDDVVTEDGARQVDLDAGTLAQGQSKDFTVHVKARSTGAKDFSAVASSADNLVVRTSVSTTKVRQPKLSVTGMNARAEQYVGREIGYTFSVSNTGDIAADNVVVEANVPLNTRYESSNNAGRMADRNVRWDLGTLMPGASKDLAMKVAASEMGKADARVSVRGTCCADVTSAASTSIIGIPALLLEVGDLSDPVEVGQTETYVITVTNQGSADATNIRMEAVLEDMSYVSSTGVTSGSASGNRITFGTLSKLKAKDAATWRVEVKADKPGDLRFKVIMNSDQLGRGVEEAESTFVY